ncbi:DoxX family protein [Phytohabitans kaempferiae]|uniref:DoxX family protein n=1 Tax=Phytohabitans kaempferiae TaxID=1620943 RepID=A0ABV6LW10_9ACTN
MNIVLWIAASVLALAFLASGATKLLRPREKVITSGYRWAEDFSRGQVKLIGVAEVLGATGLIVPPALGVLDVLSPVAAAGLALLMAGAVVVHLRRGEPTYATGPVVLAVLTAALAVLRFGPYAF